MAERKVVKARRCRQCGTQIDTTAAGIAKHEHDAHG